MNIKPNPLVAVSTSIAITFKSLLALNGPSRSSVKLDSTRASAPEIAGGTFAPSGLTKFSCLYRAMDFFVCFTA